MRKRLSLFRWKLPLTWCKGYHYRCRFAVVFTKAVFHQISCAVLGSLTNPDKCNLPWRQPDKVSKIEVKFCNRCNLCCLFLFNLEIYENVPGRLLLSFDWFTVTRSEKSQPTEFPKWRSEIEQRIRWCSKLILERGLNGKVKSHLIAPPFDMYRYWRGMAH